MARASPLSHEEEHSTTPDQHAAERDRPERAENMTTRARLASVERSRLGVYAAIGASATAVPLPWIPDALVRRVRGALVHDLAVRHGLSLTLEARDVLAEPAGADGPRGLLAQVLRFAGTRLALRTLTRLGPIGLVWPLRSAAQTYVLGHLFDRYLDLARTERAVRIDVEEARRVRRAVDGALVRAVTVQTSRTEPPTVIDDQRDATTAVIDAVLSFAAGLPALAVHRLEAAFDELLAHGHV
jgi:hypothetical protein